MAKKQAASPINEGLNVHETFVCFTAADALNAALRRVFERSSLKLTPRTRMLMHRAFITALVSTIFAGRSHGDDVDTVVKDTVDMLKRTVDYTKTIADEAESAIAARMQTRGEG